MKPVEIAKGVYDVGVTDWNIRDFHGYSIIWEQLQCFFDCGEKTVLIDTVKKGFKDQF